MHLKIILLCVLVVLIMQIANGVAKQYKDKCLIYNDIILFLNSYELNIGFKKDKMLQLITNFKCSNASKSLFDAYLNFIKEDVPINLDNIKIIEEDNDFISQMLSTLGHGDYEQEIKKIANYKAYFEKKLACSEANKNKFCPLILKLSFLFSLIVVVLIL